MIEAYPLCWPEGYKRSEVRIHSRFDRDKKFTSVRDILRDEVKRLKGSDMILSTDIPIRKADGMPYANSKEPADTGVAVYFMYKGRQVCLCCDTYRKVWENMYAIACTIKGLRTAARHGVSDFLDRTFSGFIGIPEDAGKGWWDILKVSRNASIEEIKTAYRQRLKEYHPDTGEYVSRNKYTIDDIKNALTEAMKEKNR